MDSFAFAEYGVPDTPPPAQESDQRAAGTSCPAPGAWPLRKKAAVTNQLQTTNSAVSVLYAYCGFRK